jgi:hypothetical protein
VVGFILRFLAALALVFATYNPSGMSYSTWATSAYAEQLSIVVLLGLLLFAAYIIFIRATFRSIGLFGVILVAAIISAGLWVMFDNGLLTLQNQTSLTWIGLVALAFVLALGMYWSHVRRSLSGQSDVDDIDE